LARRHVGEPRFHLATRPLLTQHNRAALIVAYDMCAGIRARLSIQPHR